MKKHLNDSIFIAVSFLLITGTSLFAYPHPEGFYKHLFMDGGAYLSPRKYFPAGNALADTLQYNFEYLATASDVAGIYKTNRVLAGNPSYDLDPAYAPDDNGYLLYPDRSPRYMMIYVNGGSSKNHGGALDEPARQNVEDFFLNGGSYIGTCAGSFISGLNECTTGDCLPRETFFHVWPSYLAYTQMALNGDQCYPGIDLVDTDSATPGNQNPLLQYHSFGGDYKVDWARHHLGPYFREDLPLPAGTAILGRYDNKYSADSGRAALITYKRDSLTGRAVLNGCHPESDSNSLDPYATGERYELFSAKIKYAATGTGLPRIKGTLKNNVARIMSLNAVAGHEKIGDYQYHHYKITLPEGAPYLKLTLDGQSGYPFNVYARQGGMAFNSLVPVLQKDLTNTNQKILTIDLPAAGEWYVGVELDTAVLCTQGSSSTRPVYTGALPTINGISYTLTAAYNDTLPPYHTIMASADSHGIISPAGATQVYEGADQIYAIIPDSAYVVDYVEVDGVDAGSLSLYNFPYVSADHAIIAHFRERVYYDTLIVDNGDSGTSSTGTWSVSSGANYYGTPSLACSGPAGSYTWQATLPDTGNYSIEMWWTRLSTRLSVIPVIIYDSLVALDTVYVNQYDNMKGGLWNLLMPVALFSTHQVRIEILHPGTAGNICADAVRIIGNPKTISGGIVAGEVSRVDVNLPFTLSACPNPFNPSLSVTYSIPVQSPVELAVFNVQGRRVTELARHALMAPGRYTTTWTGTEENGKRASSGLYIVKLRMGKRIKVFKVLMLK